MATGMEGRIQMRMDLKYCERCGGLWLRERASGLAYCVGCQDKLAAMPSRSALQAAGLEKGGRQRRRCARLPEERSVERSVGRLAAERLAVGGPSADEMVLYPVCEPSSGLNNGYGRAGGMSFRDVLADIFSLGGKHSDGRGGRL